MENFAQTTACSSELSRAAELMNAGCQLRRLIVATNGITAQPVATTKSDGAYKAKIPGGRGTKVPPDGRKSAVPRGGQGIALNRIWSGTARKLLPPQAVGKEARPGDNSVRSFGHSGPQRSPSHCRAHLREMDFHPVSRDLAFMGTAAFGTAANVNLRVLTGRRLHKLCDHRPRVSTRQ